VQVDPIKPSLKAPGTGRLKLKYDKTAFKVCFQSQLAPLHNGTYVFDIPDGVDIPTGALVQYRQGLAE
jgi:hypothetical protein